MTSFVYSSGDPTHLTSGQNALMVDLSGPFADVKARLSSSGLFDESDLTAVMVQKLGLNVGAQVGRGKSIIATTESRTNVAYGTLTTPDQVSGIVLPTDGLICVAYHAVWQNSVGSAGRAAIFLGANQLLAPPTALGGGADVVQEASGNNNAAIDVALSSYPLGLAGSSNFSGSYTGPATTGVALANQAGSGSQCLIFAAAGTYTVSVQFKSSSGSVTVKNRKLWVWTVGF